MHRTVHVRRSEIKMNKGGSQEGTIVASHKNQQTVGFNELAYSTMLQVQALVELLEEKGLLTQREVLDRVKKLQAETQARRTQ